MQQPQIQASQQLDGFEIRLNQHTSEYKPRVKKQETQVQEQKITQDQQAKKKLSKAKESQAERNNYYNRLEKQDIEKFESIVGSDNIIYDDVEMILPYTEDFTRKYTGNSQLVLTPTTQRHVQQIINYSNKRKLAIVPQGGNTGLVGGSVPLFDEIVLSLKKMNQIISFDPSSGILKCQSGCVLQVLQDYVKEYGYLMPIDLGAKGSCQIGGNIATNAGGIRFIKYGSMHTNTVGVNAVLGNGMILNETNVSIGQRYGNGLKHMLIGSEGTLGIITECAIQCQPMPKGREVCLLGVNEFENVIECLEKAKVMFSDSLSAIEYMDWASLKFSMDYLDCENPFQKQKFKFYILLEVCSNQDLESEENEIQNKMIDYFEEIEGHYEDGIISETEQQYEKLWHLRETISLGTSAYGIPLKFDVSLPSQHFHDLVHQTQKLVGNQAIAIGHGHIGDGNLHLNCCIKGFADKKKVQKIQQLVTPFVFNYIKDKNGSISAEHGVGQQKSSYLRYSKSENMIESMKLIKQIYDPNFILNPYKVLPI